MKYIYLLTISMMLSLTVSAEDLPEELFSQMNNEEQLLFSRPSFYSEINMRGLKIADQSLITLRKEISILEKYGYKQKGKVRKGYRGEYYIQLKSKKKFKYKN